MDSVLDTSPLSGDAAGSSQPDNNVNTASTNHFAPTEWESCAFDFKDTIVIAHAGDHRHVAMQLEGCMSSTARMSYVSGSSDPVSQTPTIALRFCPRVWTLLSLRQSGKDMC